MFETLWKSVQGDLRLSHDVILACHRHSRENEVVCAGIDVACDGGGGRHQRLCREVLGRGLSVRCPVRLGVALLG